MGKSTSAAGSQQSYSPVPLSGNVGSKEMEPRQCRESRHKAGTAAHKIRLFQHCHGLAMHAAMTDFIPEMRLNSLSVFSEL